MDCQLLVSLSQIYLDVVCAVVVVNVYVASVFNMLAVQARLLCEFSAG